jgi:hypothetical protein
VLGVCKHLVIAVAHPSVMELREEAVGNSKQVPGCIQLAWLVGDGLPPSSPNLHPFSPLPHPPKPTPIPPPPTHTYTHTHTPALAAR